MITRINLILSVKNLTARQFAEEIGIQPSGMSHILSGRNNPSLDFVLKLVKRYPDINLQWLLLGIGEMYATGNPSTLTAQSSTQPTVPVMNNPELDLFSQSEIFAPEPLQSGEASESHQERSTAPISEPAQPHDARPIDKAVSRAPRSVGNPSALRSEPSADTPREAPRPSEKRVVKIVVFYDDHSFAEYIPE